jgi:hypothetical protein
MPPKSKLKSKSSPSPVPSRQPPPPGYRVSGALVEGYPSDRKMLSLLARSRGLQVWDKFPVGDIQLSLQKDGVPKMSKGEQDWQWYGRVCMSGSSADERKTRSASTASRLRTQDSLEDEAVLLEDEGAFCSDGDSSSVVEMDDGKEPVPPSTPSSTIGISRILSTGASGSNRAAVDWVSRGGIKGRDTHIDVEQSLPEFLPLTLTTPDVPLSAKPYGRRPKGGKRKAEDLGSKDDQSQVMAKLVAVVMDLKAKIEKPSPAPVLDAVGGAEEQIEGKSKSQVSISAGGSLSNNVVTGTVVHNIKELHVSLSQDALLSSLSLDSMNSHVPPSLAADAKAGFYVPLFQFIRSWSHFSAASKARDANSINSKEGVCLTSDKDQFTSWASVSEAFLMMTLVSCEDNPDRLLDYAMFLLQMTAQACTSEWPVVLFYMEKIRERVLPRKPPADVDASTTQSRRDNHKLFRKIDRADWLEIYQRILSQPKAVAERLHVDLSALAAAMPAVRAVLGTSWSTSGSNQATPSSSSSPQAASFPSSSSVDGSSSPLFELCKQRKLCWKFQLGKCYKEEGQCPFNHLLAPKDVRGPSGSRSDKKESDLAGSTSANNNSNGNSGSTSSSQKAKEGAVTPEKSS